MIYVTCTVFFGGGLPGMYIQSFLDNLEEKPWSAPPRKLVKTRKNHGFLQMFPIDFLLLGQTNIPYTAWPGPQIWLTRRGKCGKDEEIVVYHLQGPDISTEELSKCGHKVRPLLSWRTYMLVNLGLWKI